MMAEYERDLIKSRTREGREAAMLKGTKFGRPKKLSEDAEREIAMPFRNWGSALNQFAIIYGDRVPL